MVRSPGRAVQHPSGAAGAMARVSKFSRAGAAAQPERWRAEERATCLSRSKSQRHGLPVWSLENIQAVIGPGRGRWAPTAGWLASRELRVPYQ